MAPSIMVQEEPLDLKSESLKEPQNSWKSINFQTGEDWPESLHSPLVWEPSDFKDEEEFVYTLNDDEIIEISYALDHFKGKIT
jgi:hypothetical protein